MKLSIMSEAVHNVRSCMAPFDDTNNCNSQRTAYTDFFLVKRRIQGLTIACT